MSAPVISLDKVSMGYRIYGRPIDLVKETILGGVRHDTFWALRDIDLTVNEGDRLGIVGPNGSGKSTLLKIICGNLTPSGGRVLVNGRISSLLSMTPAWNEDENGIENIKYNLMLQGVARSRIPAIIDDIVDFTELGAFIYQPVKTYSTGMGARLSFAIATATDPEILVVDEVLGTGDGYFAGKATARMKDFCARGRALIFVSHAVAAVQQMCDRAIWMQNGAIRLDGQVDTVVSRYELDYRSAEDKATRVASYARASAVLAAPETSELECEDVLLRIVPVGGSRFSATHYVRDIVVTKRNTGTSVTIPLTVADETAEAGGSRLDLLSSEWGRAHERQGVACRILQRTSGRNAGGHIQLGTGFVQVGADRKLDLAVEFSVASDDAPERLELQVLDLAAGRWRRLGEASVAARGDWTRHSVEGAVEVMPEQATRAQLEKLRQENRQAVQIESITLRSQGEETYVLKEGQPFTVTIEVEFRKQVPVADVGIKFTRSDGVYVFWQSSGMAPSGNLVNPSGRKTVVFRFDENVIGPGEYHTNVYVADGWNFPDNYPYSEIYDRKFDALTFRIVPRLSGLDLGAVSKTFEVSVL
jgi:lipopolysaccharide transport system ATP-binding protein